MMDNSLFSSMLPVGTMLENRYRIVLHLASGGFGNTYMAVDTRFNSRVAVKEFFMRGTNHRAEDHSTVVVSNASNQEGFDSQLDKFRREAQRIFNMRHDHIVHVTDLFDANGTSYYVMDLIDGESLKDRVKQRPLTEQEARDVADQLLDALDAVHKAGFYHLDVKPGNIMIDSKGHCTLIDFGASKQMNAMERTSLSASGMAYTPGYAPIEQEGQRIKSIGPWTDFYAVGATLYNLLTGQTPPELDPDDTDDDSRMFDYPDGISSQMQRAISRMMNPSPRKRPQNVDEMQAVLGGMPLEDINSETSSDETVASPVSRGGAYVPGRKGEASQEAQIYKGGTPPVVVEAQSSNKIILWTIIGALAVCLAVISYFLLRPSGSSERSGSPFSQNNSSAKDSTIAVSDEERLTDLTFTVNGVEFKMIAVEGGTFNMGDTSDQNNPAYDDNPAHKVTLSSFSIGETEVTQALWKAVMGNNPSYFEGDNLPVEMVSWNDCQTFIHKLNSMTEDLRPEGREFRLPSEAEWEYAARGGNKSNHTDYAGNSNLLSVAWCEGNDGKKTHPVAQKKANELGLYDMSGNVWEWCQDWYDENYYSRSPSINPCNTTKTSEHVYRGGGYCDDEWNCSVANRTYNGPGDVYEIIGLRLVL